MASSLMCVGRNIHYSGFNSLSSLTTVLWNYRPKVGGLLVE